MCTTVIDTMSNFSFFRLPLIPLFENLPEKSGRPVHYTATTFCVFLIQLRRGLVFCFKLSFVNIPPSPPAPGVLNPSPCFKHPPWSSPPITVFFPLLLFFFFLYLPHAIFNIYFQANRHTWRLALRRPPSLFPPAIFLRSSPPPETIFPEDTRCQFFFALRQHL